MITRVLADNGLPGLDRVPVWFNDPSNYWGPDGLVVRIREHLIFSAVILLIAILIALPLGLLIGHTGRGVVLVAGLANALRAIPTLGLRAAALRVAQPGHHQQDHRCRIWSRAAGSARSSRC